MILLRTTSYIPCVEASRPWDLKSYIIISRTQVPQYLQKGAFYEALDPHDGDTFSVPFSCLKPDLSIESHEDLRHMLHSIRFWGVYSIPVDVCQYLLSTPQLYVTIIDPLLVEFPEFEEYLTNVIALRTTNATDTISSAISMGLGVEVVQFLHERLEISFSPDDLDAAIRKDDVASMIYVFDKLGRTTISNNTSVIVATHGSINVLKYMLEHGWVIPRGALNAAARGGHIECVTFLHDKCGMAYTLETMMFASHSGRLALIQYLHEMGCPWDGEVCARLASVGALDCLAYAHQNGCPWDARTCAAAAGSGHLQCLEYAHQQGCVWDASTVNNAFWLNHRACLQYAVSRGCSTNGGQFSTLVAIAYSFLIAISFMHKTYWGLQSALFLLLCMRVVEIFKYNIACKFKCSFHTQSAAKGLCGLVAYVVFVSDTLIVYERQIFDSVDWLTYAVGSFVLFFIIPLFVIANVAL
jgi:hypothetical protein